MPRILILAIIVLSYSCNTQPSTVPAKNVKLLEGIFCKWHMINPTTWEVYIRQLNDTCKLYKSYKEIDLTEIHYLKKNGKPNVRVIYIEKKDTATGLTENVIQGLIPIYE